MQHNTFGSIFIACLAAAVTLGLASSALAQYPSVSEAPSIESSGADDVAVVVTVEDYVFLPDVKGAIATGTDWETYFRKGMGMKTVYVRADSRATREDILKFAKRASSEVDEGATLWFVFVGHGAPTKDGEDGLLVGVDAQGRPSSLKARGVTRAEVLEALGKGKQKRTVAIFDACFSGKSSPDVALAKGLQPVVPTKSTKIGDESAIVLSAASHDEYAGALPGANRPAFSYMLLGALRGWADDGDKSVTAGEAIAFARRNLRYLDHDQTPQLSGKSDTVLVRGAGEKDPGLGHHLNRAMRPAKTSSSSPSESNSSKPTTSSEETSTAEQYYEMGAQLHRQKKYSQARTLYRKGCESGHGFSCAALGTMYEKGVGGDEDVEFAVELYKVACRAKIDDACFLTGFHYQRGDGVKKDHLAALKYLEQACSRDHGEACSGIAGMFFNTGLGVKPDPEKASAYGQKACRLGAHQGCYYAAFTEEDRHNYGLAATLYNKACKSGNLSSCNNLGTLYLEGKGVPKDIDRARKFYRDACRKGAETACNNLKVIQGDR